MTTLGDIIYFDMVKYNTNNNNVVIIIYYYNVLQDSFVAAQLKAVKNISISPLKYPRKSDFLIQPGRLFHSIA